MACSALPEPGTGKSATLLCYYLLEQHGVLDALQIEVSAAALRTHVTLARRSPRLDASTSFDHGQIAGPVVQGYT